MQKPKIDLLFINLGKQRTRIELKWQINGKTSQVDI